MYYYFNEEIKSLKRQILSGKVMLVIAYILLPLLAFATLINGFVIYNCIQINNLTACCFNIIVGLVQIGLLISSPIIINKLVIALNDNKKLLIKYLDLEEDWKRQDQLEKREREFYKNNGQ